MGELRGPSSASPIHPARVRYIKLGTRGGWEAECLQKGIIRIGFGTEKPNSLHLCRSRNWAALAESFKLEGKDPRTASRFSRELRLFFDDEGATLWITFIKERLYWGFLDGSPAELHKDGDGVWRRVRGGWRSEDLSGTTLSKNRLSGALTKLAAYRGTSCEVEVTEYVVRRINGQKMPAVERALAATRELHLSALDLIRMMAPQDFELLVDLVFTSSGWRRLGVVGRTQDTLDLDLSLPSTGERGRSFK